MPLALFHVSIWGNTFQSEGLLKKGAGVGQIQSEPIRFLPNSERITIGARGDTALRQASMHCCVNSLFKGQEGDGDNEDILMRKCLTYD